MHMFALFGPLRTEMNIFLLFHLLRLVRFHIRKGRKMHPFFAQPARIGHYREHPLGPPSGWTTVRLQNRKLGPICTQKLLLKQILSSSTLNKCGWFFAFFQILFENRQSSKAPRRNLPCGKNWKKNRLNKQKCAFLVKHLLLSHYSFH